MESPAEHCYCRVITDAVRAVEALRALPGVDPTRVSVTGGSQGGGLALAAAGLVPGTTAALPDVPFLCHVRRAVTLTDPHPYAEIADHLRVHRGAEHGVLRTFDYLDVAHLGTRATAPALFSVALMDEVCPPSTVYADYHHYGHQDGSAIDVYRYNRHEGGEGYRWPAQRAFLEALGFLTVPGP